MDKGLIVDLGIWIGTTLAILNIVDWLLLNHQKDFLKQKFEDIWLWLAGLNYSILPKIINTSFWLSAIILLITIASSMYVSLSLIFFPDLVPLKDSFMYVYKDLGNFGPILQTSYAISILISIYVIYKYIYSFYLRWLTKKKSLISYLSRLIFSSTLWFCLLFIIGMTMIYFLFPKEILRTDNLPIEDCVNLFKIKYGNYGYYLLFFLYIIIFSPLVSFHFLIYLNLHMSLFWIVVSLSILSVSKVIQFILIRAIYSKKGPVLGFSVVLVGISSLIKVLVS